MNDAHTCGHCGGSGLVTLTGIYKKTLELLRKQSSPTSAHALARIAKCKGCAMCNRLAQLDNMGYALSGRYGRERRYVAKENYMGDFDDPVSPALKDIK